MPMVLPEISKITWADNATAKNTSSDVYQANV